MYASVGNDGTQGLHVHVEVERGSDAGTWHVAYMPADAAWRVRGPRGTEYALGRHEAWVGELDRELDDVLCRVARRAVGEALARQKAQVPPLATGTSNPTGERAA